MSNKTKRVFTDDDLRAIEMDAEDQIEMNGAYDMEDEVFYGLLARLDAAEKCMRLAEEDGFSDKARAAYNEWLETAGKRIS